MLHDLLAGILYDEQVKLPYLVTGPFPPARILAGYHLLEYAVRHMK